MGTPFSLQRKSPYCPTTYNILRVSQELRSSASPAQIAVLRNKRLPLNAGQKARPDTRLCGHELLQDQTARHPQRSLLAELGKATTKILQISCWNPRPSVM